MVPRVSPSPRKSRGPWRPAQITLLRGSSRPLRQPRPGTQPARRHAELPGRLSPRPPASQCLTGGTAVLAVQHPAPTSPQHNAGLGDISSKKFAELSIHMCTGSRSGPGKDTARLCVWQQDFRPLKRLTFSLLLTGCEIR